jgi:hypothetical protein
MQRSLSQLRTCSNTSSNISGHVQHLAPTRRTSSVFQHHSDPVLATLVAEIAASPSLCLWLPLLPLHPLGPFTVPLSHPTSFHLLLFSYPLHHPCYILPSVKTPIPLVIITSLVSFLVHHSIGLSQVSVSLLHIAFASCIVYNRVKGI